VNEALIPLANCYRGRQLITTIATITIQLLVHNPEQFTQRWQRVAHVTFTPCCVSPDYLYNYHHQVPWVSE